MKKQNDNNTENIKPDLKHDTMEYSAATEGEDILDMDTETEEEIEEEEITADELEVIDNDSEDGQAAALNSVELDRNADDDIIFNEDDVEEIEEDDEEEDDDDELHRK